MSAINLSKESLKAIMNNRNTVVSKENKMTNSTIAIDKIETTKLKTSELALKARALFKWLIPPALGLLMLLAIWTIISQQSPNLPGPIKTWYSAIELFSDPFYDNGPNDKGVGWNILASLQRVGLGFGLAALVGIPMGFIIGRFEFASKMCAPVISLLRPVSPRCV